MLLALSVRVYSNEDDSKLEYLKQVSSHVNFLKDANQFLLQNIIACAEGKNNGIIIDIHYPSLELESKIKKEFSCDSLLEKYLPLNNLEQRDQFKKVVRGLMLIRPRFRDDNPIISETIDGDVYFKINRRVEHLSLGAMRPIKVDRELEDSFKESVLHVYNQSIIKNCSDYISSRNIFEFNPFDLDLSLPNNLCDYLVRRSWRDLPQLDGQTTIVLKGYQRNFVAWSKSQREGWRKKIEDEVIRIYQRYPHFAFFRNEMPHRSQQRDALNEMLEMSYLLKSYEEICADESDLYKCYLPLYSFVERSMYFSFIELSFSDGSANTQAIRDAVSLDYQKMKRNQAFLDGGVALGSIIGCFVFPYARLGGLVARFFTRNLCFFGIGIGLDAYFIPGATTELLANKRSFISTMDYNYAVMNIETLDQSRKHFLYSLAFVPLNFIGITKLFK